jgi:lipopolysaccharide/colanic/teichoic acid biosynthesis glycosyltransferase
MRDAVYETYQLWNILTGDMPFVGPPPLVLIDQHAVQWFG